MSFQSQNLRKKLINKGQVSLLPETPGVYIFWNKKRKAVYVGKANNLKRRVSSYLTTKLSKKTSKMIKEADKFSFVRVNSELEALLLEASLVKKNQPKYNFVLRDDKHPLYIKITREKYPRVLTARKIEENLSAGGKNIAFFGPFPSSTNVKCVLRILRKILPFSDHKLGKRECLYNNLYYRENFQTCQVY